MKTAKEVVKLLLFILTAILLPGWVELIWGDLGKANNTASKVPDRDLT